MPAHPYKIETDTVTKDHLEIAHEWVLEIHAVHYLQEKNRKL